MENFIDWHFLFPWSNYNRDHTDEQNVKRLRQTEAHVVLLKL